MENENVDELKVLIPSEYVRNYALETGWVFTDEQKAVLLVYGSLPLKELHSRLQALQKNTSDRNLQSRITKYLNREDLKFQAFKENSDKAYIYILKVKDGDIPYPSILPTEYFFDLDLAYECGCETNLPFMIEKYLIEDPEISSQLDPVTTYLKFNIDGEAVYFYGRIPGDDKESEDFYDFFEVPNPFERGDIVKRVGTDEYGIVDTSQEMWKGSIAKYKNSEWHQKHWDFSDVQIKVEFLKDDGTFDYDHVNPIDLERYQPEKDGYKSGPMDKLLMCASDIHRGEGSLDELFFRIMDYRETREVAKNSQKFD